MSNIKKFDRDSDGFLNDPQDWDIKFVETVSSEFNIELKDNHWEIINYVREYFEKHHKVPELRELLKSFRIKFGENKACKYDTPDKGHRMPGGNPRDMPSHKV